MILQQNSCETITETAATIPTDSQFWLNSFLKGPAQVFLIGNSITGIIFLIALAVSSLWATFFAIIGSLVALIIAVLFGADAASIQSGLFGFSPVLTGFALGSTFYKPGLRVFFYTLLGIIFTVFVQAALDIALTPIGVPTFTALRIIAIFIGVSMVILLLVSFSRTAIINARKYDPINNVVTRLVHFFAHIGTRKGLCGYNVHISDY